MPIHNLTTGTSHAFMKLGKIKKGDRGGKNGAPRDLDHFRITYMDSPKAKQLEEAFRSVYGPEPTEINVRVPYNEIEKFWDANYECYRQGGLVAQAGSTADGMYWIFYRDPDTSEVLVRGGSAVGEAGRKFLDNTPCREDTVIYRNASNEPMYLEPVGRLQVVIPELANIEVGYFEFTPGSPRDIRNITAELSAFDALARGAGKGLAGIPFKLIRRKEAVTKKIKDKLTQGDSWVVHITTGGEWGVKAIEAVERMALPEIIDVEAEDVVDVAFSPEPPAKELPAETSDPDDEMISPFDQRAVEYAAKKWHGKVSDETKADAARELGRLKKEGRITDTMGKKAFKKIVDGGG